eukprot:1157784-Pelagomonas_calceolata.AAC.6
MPSTASFALNLPIMPQPPSCHALLCPCFLQDVLIGVAGPPDDFCSPTMACNENLSITRVKVDHCFQHLCWWPATLFSMADVPYQGCPACLYPSFPVSAAVITIIIIVVIIIIVILQAAAHWPCSPAS